MIKMRVATIALTLLALLLGLAMTPTAAEAETWAQRRAKIKAMPLLDRPYRIGHFYGNSVRRRHYGAIFYGRFQR